MQRFKDLVPKYNIQSKSSLRFDVPTQWTSTYDMLDTTIKFEPVFGAINLPSGDKESEKPPDNDDWAKAKRLVVFLKGFYLLTRRIFGSLYVTSSKDYFEVAAVYDMFKRWEKSVNLKFKSMACSMKKKYDKYWAIGGT